MDVYIKITQIVKSIVRKYNQEEKENEIINELYLLFHDKSPSLKEIKNSVYEYIRNEKHHNKLFIGFNDSFKINNINIDKSWIASDKKCNDCKEFLPLSVFRKSILKTGKIKYDSCCYNCRRERTRMYYINNKTKMDLANKEWRKKNPERYAKIQKRWVDKFYRLKGSKRRNKPVALMDNNNIVLKIFPSLISAAKFAGCSKSESLSKAIKNNKEYRGYRFKMKL